MLNSQYDRFCDPPPPQECLRWGQFRGWRPDNLINATYLGRNVVARYYGTAEPYVGEMLPIAFKQGIYTMWGRNVVVEPERGGVVEKCCVKIFSYVFRFAEQEIDFYLSGDREPELIATIVNPYLGIPGATTFGAPNANTWVENGSLPPQTFQSSTCSCKEDDWCASFAVGLGASGAGITTITAYFISAAGVSTHTYTTRPGGRFRYWRLYGNAIQLHDRIQPESPVRDEVITNYGKDGQIISQHSLVYPNSPVEPGIVESIYGYSPATTVPPGTLSDPAVNLSGFIFARQETELTDGKGNELIETRHFFGNDGAFTSGQPFFALNNGVVSEYHPYFTWANMLFGTQPPGFEAIRYLNLIGSRLYLYADGAVYCRDLKDRGNMPGSIIDLDGTTLSVNGNVVATWSGNPADPVVPVDPLPDWDPWGAPWRNKNRCKPIPPEFQPPGTVLTYKAAESITRF